jgi:uncharacterized protein
MAEDLIRYDVLAQDALRGVVRKVLTEVAQAGLPGEHHFFVTFDTRYPGVRISSRLRAQYPNEMTVVLQHQFWDLSVTETAFEVGLSFNGVPERLLVPYRAIKAFVDPHASFGLKFDAGLQPRESAEPAETAEPEPAPQEGEPAEAEAEKALEAAQGGVKPKKGKVAGADVVSLDQFRKKGS